MDTRVDGSIFAVLVAYQKNLVSSENDDVTSGSISTPPMSGKVDFCNERVKAFFAFWLRENCGQRKKSFVLARIFAPPEAKNSSDGRKRLLRRLRK